ncbi:helix-turn-helix transcriptional regulator [Clostridium sp.]|uniref:helix-turn-helix transcriptional regulator n=1 Tax=Clostridium sp. TaxID=1506 RepID=UPI00284FEF7B|nr:helix-turn-helix transcriptional regulator [Clostridium sp.]MDR3597690.1 helix-turn-helix transcriptional regulator [Clostridium sp.]
MNIGYEIKIKRIKNKVKAIDLALKLGISPSKLSLIENERVKCPEDLYQKIEEELGGYINEQNSRMHGIRNKK